MTDIKIIDSERDRDKITLSNMDRGEIWLSDGSRTLVPDVSQETRRAAVDFIRGDTPTTVLGLLMTRGEPLSVESVAGLLGVSVEEVEWTIEMLEENELCARITQEDGLVKVFAFAPYTERYS